MFFWKTPKSFLPCTAAGLLGDFLAVAQEPLFFWQASARTKMAPGPRLSSKKQKSRAAFAAPPENHLGTITFTARW